MQFERRRGGAVYVAEAYADDQRVLLPLAERWPTGYVQWEMMGIPWRNEDGTLRATGPTYVFWRPKQVATTNADAMSTPPTSAASPSHVNGERPFRQNDRSQSTQGERGFGRRSERTPASNKGNFQSKNAPSRDPRDSGERRGQPGTQQRRDENRRDENRRDENRRDENRRDEGRRHRDRPQQQQQQQQGRRPGFERSDAGAAPTRGRREGAEQAGQDRRPLDRSGAPFRNQPPQAPAGRDERRARVPHARDDVRPPAEARTPGVREPVRPPAEARMPEVREDVRPTAPVEAPPEVREDVRPTAPVEAPPEVPEPGLAVPVEARTPELPEPGSPAPAVVEAPRETIETQKEPIVTRRTPRRQKRAPKPQSEEQTAPTPAEGAQAETEVQPPPVPMVQAAPVEEPVLPETIDAEEVDHDLALEGSARSSRGPRTTRHKNITRLDREDKDMYGYLVRLMWRGETRQKFFSDRAYEHAQAALDAAILWRDEMERELGKPRSEGLVVGRASSNTGIVGVTRTTKRGDPVFQVTWYEDGRQRRRVFNIRLLGESRALRAAIKARAAAEEQRVGSSDLRDESE